MIAHNEEGRRTLTLSIVRVEVRLYRRLRTSANTVQQPSHFEYIVRCGWTGSPVKKAPRERGVRNKSSARPGSSSLQRAEVDSAADSDAGKGPGFWWDELPSSYAVQRRWAEIVRFHEALVSDLAYDSERGCRRVKTRVPELPSKGNLDAFHQAVAATGDARSLHRPRGETLRVEKVREKTHEELADLHVIYKDNRLSPYFEEVNKILSELPTDVLQESSAVRRFATGGVVTMKQVEADSEFERAKIYGPRPLLLDETEADAAARVVRQRPDGVKFLKLSKGADQNAGRDPLSPASPASSNMSPARQGSPRSPMPKSASAPALAPPLEAAAARGLDSPAESGTPTSRTMNLLAGDSRSSDPEARERRLGSSHYGFFARSMGPEAFGAFGSRSLRDFWNRMAAKERKELSRRTLLPLGHSEEGNRQTRSAGSLRSREGRLPALPPPTPDPYFRPTTESRLYARNRHNLKATMKSLGEPPKDVAETKRAEIRYDICDGLRVTVLNEPANSVKKRGTQTTLPEDRPIHNKVSSEEALKVYRVYRQMLDMDEGCDIRDPDDSDVDDGEGANTGGTVIVSGASLAHAATGGHFHDEPAHAVENQDAENPHPPLTTLQRRASRLDMAVQHGFSRELMPISWPTFFTWAQREVDFASHFRYKSVCQALLRAAKLWRLLEATKDQRFYGASLNMLFQWMWPQMSYADMWQVMTWIGLHEIEKIRRPTPCLIDAQERRQLESIFNSMDPKGRGYCTCEDIAGGQIQGIEAKLRNIVDVDTVRKVCGERRITLPEFLEFMCEDNYKAHEDATHCVLDTGQRLVEVSHPALGFTGWVLRDVPKSELSQRRLITAIEAEVVRWRTMSEVRRTALSHLLAQGFFFL